MMRRGKGGHLRVGGQLSASPYSTSPTKNAIANLANLSCKAYGKFFITPRRYGLREMELLD